MTKAVSSRFGSGHMASIAGKDIEGPVPADAMKRLLAIGPDAAGRARPGMRPGSPGMEVGERHDPDRVFPVDRSGDVGVFTSDPTMAA